MNNCTEFWHKEIFEIDLVNINRQTQNCKDFYDCLVDSADKVKQQQFRPGWQLEYDLTDKAHHHKQAWYLYISKTGRSLYRKDFSIQ